MGNRRPLIAGNWKMHTTVVDGCRLALDLAKGWQSKEDREVLVAPPFTILSEVAHVLEGSAIMVAAQNSGMTSLIQQGIAVQANLTVGP